MGFKIGLEIEQEFVELIQGLPEHLLKSEGVYEIDPFELAKAYFDTEEVVDMTIDPNANINGKSPVNFNSEIFKPLLKLRSYHLLWKGLKKRFGVTQANYILGEIFSGLVYFHDITKVDVPYCFAPDTSFLMLTGRPYGWLPSVRPKKLQSFMGQLREMTMDFSQENAGAIGIANVLVNMAYFTKDGKATDKEVEDEIQQTIHVFHNTFRIGGDSPFTNISLFDRETLKATFGGAVYPDGSKVVDNIEEIMRVQKIYAEFFSKGSPKTGKPYRFPVTTINIKVDENGKIIDQEFFNLMADLNRQKCVFNWHIGEKIASCCRLTSDLAALKEQIRTDTFGNGGISIGSHRVVTINLHRVALEAKAYGVPIEQTLDNALGVCEALLVSHKEDILRKRVESGVLKFFRIGWCDLNMFFSTIGFTGLFDAYRVMKGKDAPVDEAYVEFASKILDTMEKYAKQAGERNKGFAFNVEEIPGENASPKLAKKDALVWNTDLQLLSNQMVPLYEDVDLFTRLKISGHLMNKVSGGAILHLNIEDELTEGANRELLRRVIEEYKIPHFALNKGFSTCERGHTTVGIVQSCPECGSTISSYTTRVVGFFTDTKDWIKARRSYEFPRRIWYAEEDVINESSSGR